MPHPGVSSRRSETPRNSHAACTFAPTALIRESQGNSGVEGVSGCCRRLVGAVVVPGRAIGRGRVPRLAQSLADTTRMTR